mgnify:FL=1
MGLRSMIEASVELRLEVLYVVTVRLPLEVILAKAVWRYYRRLAPGASPDYPPLGVVAAWARAQDC